MTAVRLAAWRLAFLLCCLIGAQHAALVHAFEHLPSSAASLAAEEHGGGRAHGTACPDCLSAHTLSSLAADAHLSVPAAVRAHVLYTGCPAASHSGVAPEPCGHGPPQVSPI